MGWVVAALRRLRAERLPAIGLAVLVLVTGFVFGVAPRALDSVADGVLRDEVASANDFARNIQLVEQTRIAPALPEAGVDVLEPVVERGTVLLERLPAGLRSIMADGGWQVDSGRHRIHDRSQPFFLRFRVQEGLDDRLRYVEGRPPTDATRQIEGVTIDDEDTGPLEVLEIALARRTADLFEVEIGETLVLIGDPGDQLIGRGRTLQYRAVELVGIYELVDPADRWWMGDLLIRQAVPRILDPTLDAIFYDAAAVLAREAYPVLMENTEDAHPPLQYTWRGLLDVGRLESESADGLLTDLRRALVTYPSTVPTPVYETGYRTGLYELIERQQRSWKAANGILGVVALGPAIIAVAALALIALLAAQRRRAALAVARSRGASIGQLVAAVVAESLLLTVPAVVVAAGLALLLIPSGPTRPTILGAAGVALLTTVILVSTSVPSASASAARGGRDTGVLRPPGPRRLIGEALLVVVAVGGAWLLRERGIQGRSAAGALEDGDPLIAAVPALVGLAAGIAAVRLFPLPMRLLAWLAAARRDLVPLLAMRRVTSGHGVGPVLTVLLAAATIGAFSSAALVHLERAAETVAWQEVGAPYRLTSPAGPLPGVLDPGALPGVEVASPIYRTTVPVGLSGPRVQLLIVEVDTYRRVVAGTPADPELPGDLGGPGTDAIPALVSSSLSARPDGASPGETFQLSVEGYTFGYRATSVRDSFPGVDAGSHFIVVSRAHFLAAGPSAQIAPTEMILRAPDTVGDELTAAATDIVAGGIVEQRAERTAELRGSPVVGAVRGGITAAALVAGGYAALAVAAALALAGLARSVEVAHLRTLGLSRREGVGLVVVEHGPTVVAAFAAGVGLGLGLFLLLRPGLGLSALLGSTIDVPLTIEAGQLILVGLAIAMIVVLGLGIAAVLQRAASPVAAIRRGFE